MKKSIKFLVDQSILREFINICAQEEMSVEEALSVFVRSSVNEKELPIILSDYLLNNAIKNLKKKFPNCTFSDDDILREMKNIQKC